MCPALLHIYLNLSKISQTKKKTSHLTQCDPRVSFMGNELCVVVFCLSVRDLINPTV